MKPNVSFSETKRTPYSSNKASSGYARFLIKMKIVKNERNANILLIIIALIAFGISGWMMYSNVFETNTTTSAGNTNIPNIFNQN